MSTPITRDQQAKALVRGQTELALELIDGAKIDAAADRLDTVVQALRTYAKTLQTRGRGSMRGGV